MTKTVCFFGIYDPAYARNRVLIKGFWEHGWRVLEVRADPRRFSSLRKYIELVRQYRRVRREPIDLVIVAFPGHTVMWLARLLFGRRIVFDAFLSLYDSNVFDRKVHFEHSIASWLDWFWDWSSSRLAGRVLIDTDAHARYFAESYHLPRSKFVRVFIGTDELFAAQEAPVDERLVHFHGTFIPLHGIDTILEAAQELGDLPLRIRILGRGQEYERMHAFATHLALKNVEFERSVPLNELPSAIAPAAICLGIFGSTEKAARVVPNKVYEYLAMGKAAITADTPALHELEELGTPLPLVLVPANDPHALAEAIRALAGDPARRQALGRAARAFYEEHLTPKAVVERLLPDLADMLES